MSEAKTAEPAPPDDDGRLVRRTDLMFFPIVAARLREALVASDVAEQEWERVCMECVTARCTVCENELSGQDWAHWLLNLGLENEGEKRAMKFIRLEKGSCSDLKCNARFYQLSFEKHPGIDWAAIYIGALETEEAKPKKSKLGQHAVIDAWEAVKRQFTPRVGVALGVLLALWIVHQYYTGGEIPIIRPAKHYESIPEPTNQFNLDGR